MAQFDVYRLRDTTTLVVDCQTDWLSELPTRFVVPLETVDRVPVSADRLHPAVDVLGERRVIKTELGAAVRKSDLGLVVASLESERDRIRDALDVLITGF